MTVRELLLTERINMDIKFNLQGHVFDTRYQSNEEILYNLNIMGLADVVIDQIEILDSFTLEGWSF